MIKQIVVSSAPQPLSMRPLGHNNTQENNCDRVTAKKGGKVTAKADSTGLENDKIVIIKHHHSVKKPQTASVAKRNLRERTRVRGVNDGFGNLKRHVPDLKSKSSKVETLRGAIQYIKKLKELLGEEISNTSLDSIKLEEDEISGEFQFINKSIFS